MLARFEELTESFVTGKIGISDAFLAAPLAQKLQQNLMRMHTEGLMQQANVGNRTALKDPKQNLRGDKIYWLDKKNHDTDQLEFLDMIDQFIDYLNRSCYTGINACEFHYAYYEAGSFYKRHKDQFRNDAARKYSLVSYLNDNWLNTDGGELQVYKDDTVQKILPASGRAVFFRSDDLEHEVMAATRPRLSVTGWLKRI
ncbi:MAG: proline hydroxylase [Bacteroidetes bacterium 46-16]|nr:MAG: proline hydroxylase [Bacteroidetes bacterium 46-16]